MDSDEDTKTLDFTQEEHTPSGNWTEDSAESPKTPLHHSYDNATYDGTPRKRNATLDNNAQQDGMLRSKEWKWKEGDAATDKTEGKHCDENESNHEEDTDNQPTDNSAEETKTTDIQDSGDDTDMSEDHIDSSQDLTPEKEFLSREGEALEEQIPLMKLQHFAINLLKCERVPSFRNIHEPGQEHLSPLVEGEVMDFSRDQTPVGSCHNIAHHLTVADESFLYNSQLSLGSFTEKKKRLAGTMQNLHEHDSFLNLTSEKKIGQVMHRALIYLKDDISFGSLAALNTIAIRETEKDHLLDAGKPIYAVPSKNHTKNVLALSASIALVFIALGSVRNLQSSINHEGGVGVLSMAVSFIGYMLGSIVSPTVVQVIQPKKCVIMGLIPHLIYVGSNIYPTMWLLSLTSLFQGIALAIAWNAMSTYITLLSTGQAQTKGQDYSEVSSRYFGIFGLFFQSYFIVGNLIASLVLTNDGDSSSDTVIQPRLTNTSALSVSDSKQKDSSSKGQIQPFNHSYTNVQSQSLTSNDPSDYIHLCGAKFWQHYDLGGGAYDVSIETKYLLFGTYVGCVVVSILIALFILEPLNPKLFNRTKNRSQQLKRQLHSLLRLWMSPKFLTIVPLLMYSFMEVGFVTAEVTKAFVTCPIGIHMVGYTMMCMGIVGSLSSYISGIIITWVGRRTQIIFAAVANLAVLVFLLIWHPTRDSYVPYFVILGMWGLSDGIWVAQINSFLCVAFPDSYEEAFSGLRMCQGIGVAVVFGLSQSLSMESKIYLTGVWCLFAVILYVIRDVYQTRQNRSPIVMEKFIMRQTSV